MKRQTGITLKTVIAIGTIFILVFLIGLLSSCNAIVPMPTVALPPTNSSTGRVPESAVLEIDGLSQLAMIGSYCWEYIDEAGEKVNSCLDSVGIPTQKEPLIANTPFTLLLLLPTNDPPAQLSLSVFPASNNNELEVDTNHHLWSYVEGQNRELALQTQQEIEMSLEPGLYVFNVFAVWVSRGDVSYGFLVKVQYASLKTAG